MSQVVTYRDKRPVVAKAYSPGGCPIPEGKQKCGETQGLDIIMDFHKLYREKMNEIDVSAGGDSLQEKVDLQEQWIDDLTAQNKLLARVIEELESETIGRVQQLEDKLNNAVKSFGEDASRALPEKENDKLEENPKALPIEEDVKEKIGESDNIKQDNQLKHIGEKLPSIAEVNEQEIISQNCIRTDSNREEQQKEKEHETQQEIICEDRIISDVEFEEQPEENPKIYQQDRFEEFVKDIKGRSTPSPPNNRDLPKCKDYCYMFRLLSELTALKLQVNLKDELLVQQLNIIKALATRLFIMETCFKRLGKTPEEILAEELMSGRIF